MICRRWSVLACSLAVTGLKTQLICNLHKCLLLVGQCSWHKAECLKLALLVSEKCELSDDMEKL